MLARLETYCYVSTTVALCFRGALRTSVLYRTEASKAQKIIGDTVVRGQMLLQFTDPTLPVALPGKDHVQESKVQK